MLRKKDEPNRHKVMIPRIKKKENYTMMAMMMIIMIISLKLVKSFWTVMKLIHLLVSFFISYSFIGAINLILICFVFYRKG